MSSLSEWLSSVNQSNIGKWMELHSIGVSVLIISPRMTSLISWKLNDLWDETASLFPTSKLVMKLLDRKKRLYMLHSKRLWTAIQIDIINTSRKVKAAAASMKRVFFFEKFSALQVLSITNFRMKKIPFEIKVRWWNFSFKFMITPVLLWFTLNGHSLESWPKQ